MAIIDDPVRLEKEKVTNAFMLPFGSAPSPSVTPLFFFAAAASVSSLLDVRGSTILRRKALPDRSRQTTSCGSTFCSDSYSCSRLLLLLLLSPLPVQRSVVALCFVCARAFGCQTLYRVTNPRPAILALGKPGLPWQAGRAGRPGRVLVAGGGGPCPGHDAPGPGDERGGNEHVVRQGIRDAPGTAPEPLVH